MHERRTYIRVPAGIEARYQLVKELIAPRVARTKDISFSGMRFTSLEQLRPAERVFVTLNLPKEGEVRLTGVVIWGRRMQGNNGNFEVGLRWEPLPPPIRARLTSFLAEQTNTQVPMSAVPVSDAFPIMWSRAIFLGLLGFLLLVFASWIWLQLN